MGAAPIELGALVVMLALLAKSDLFADLKPTTKDEKPECGFGEKAVLKADGTWVCVPNI